MGVGFWHLDGSHMEDDFAFRSAERARMEAENQGALISTRSSTEWEERQERMPVASHWSLIHISILSIRLCSG